MTFLNLIQKANNQIFQSKTKAIFSLGSIFLVSLIFILIIHAYTGVQKFIPEFVGYNYNDNLVFAAHNLPVGEGEVGEIFNNKYIPPYEGRYTYKTDTFQNDEITESEMEQLRNIKNVKKVTPEYNIQLEYIESPISGEKIMGWLTEYPKYGSYGVLKGDPKDLEQVGNIFISSIALKSLGYSDITQAMNQKISVAFLTQDHSNKISSNLYLPENTEAKTNYERDLRIESLTIKGVNMHSEFLLIGEPTLKYLNKYNDNKIYDVILEIQENLSESERAEIRNSLNELDMTYYGALEEAQTNDLTRVKKDANIILGIIGGMTLLGLIAIFFTTLNTQLLTGLQRTKEIGLLRALGMKKIEIFWLFTLESVITGLVASSTAFIISLGILPLLNYILQNWYQEIGTNNLLEFSPLGLLVILIMSLILFTASIFPAIKASNQDPIKALRYE